MTAARQRLGQQGEALAAQHLRHKGYEIIEQNYRTRFGEIDIIAKHKGVWVFVEVKMRQTQGYGNPKWAITPKKQRKISMAALSYLKKQRALQKKARFDVVTIQTSEHKPIIEVIPNAFELAYT